MDQVIVLEGPDTGTSFELRRGDTVIGRDPTAQIVLHDRFVSRRHFVIQRSSGELWLKDLGARNPVQRNGAPARETELRSGDRLRVGETELLVLRGRSAAAPPDGFDAGAATLDLDDDLGAGPPRGAATRRSEAPPETAARGGPFARILGDAPALRAALHSLERAARLDAPLLILGETGTGKELAAEAAHLASPRARGPFIQVNGAGIPDTLAESELFGHEKGAFTGADRQRRGQLELAHGGTLFLDEVGEVPLPMQAKLLRALETRSFRRVGGAEPVKADFRLVAATNRDLPAEVQAGRFRADLYYRLNVFSVTLPPLRERGADVRLLARHFFEAAREECRGEAVELPETTLQLLEGLPWPGNIRELKNAVLRAVICRGGVKLSAADFEGAGRRQPSVAPGSQETAPPRDLRDLRQLEREEIERALEFTGGNKTRAARILGISRSTLYEKLAALAASGE